jgi:MFS family permease
MVVGAVGFALTSTVRGVPPRCDAPGSGPRLGALASPGMRTVALAAMGFGVVIGFVEVGVPAAATSAGHQAMGGLLLSLWSISSVLFGLVYGMRPWPREIHLRLPALLVCFAALVSLLSVPSDLLGLAGALLLAGTMITPQSTTHSTALEQVAPPEAITEAFGWVITAVTLGLALGQSAGGWLVEHASTSVAFLVAAAAGLVVGSVVWLLRPAVAAGVPAPAPVVP